MCLLLCFCLVVIWVGFEQQIKMSSNIVQLKYELRLMDNKNILFVQNMLHCNFYHIHVTKQYVFAYT